MFYDTGWTKAVSAGQCASYTYLVGGNEYYVHRGMTLGSIEDQICQGIYFSWKGAYPNLTQYSCNITRKDSSEFEIQGLGRVKCWRDNTDFTLQCLSNFKLKIEEPCDVSSPGDPSLICVSNRINGLTPKEKILWSGTDKEVAPVIKICADGSLATRIEFINNNPGIRTSDVVVTVESDPYERNTELSGKLILDELKDNSISFFFKHPDYLPFTMKEHSREDKLIIRYGEKEFRIPVEIYRAPVIMIHGLWSDRRTFLKMKNKLVDDDFYPDELIYPGDYRTRNGASFQTNAQVVPDNINVMLNICRTYRYSAGRVDVIGHSMGGLLSRYYLQSEVYTRRYDMHKLITINTPHSGTQLANFLTNTNSAVSLAGRLAGEIIVGKFMDVSLYDGAMHDMAVNSPAMDYLNSQRLNNCIVPSRSITTEVPLTVSSWLYLILASVEPIMPAANFLIYLYNNQPNDLMVTVPSQTGGLPVINTLLVENQMHLFSAENLLVMEDVEKSLSVRPSDAAYFGQAGFHPVTQTSPYKSASIHAPADIIPGSLTITSPLRNQSFNPEALVPVSLSSRNGISRIILEAINLTDNTFVKDTTFSSGTILYTIPKNAFGKVKLLALGYHSGQLIGFDTLSVNVIPPSEQYLDSIRIMEKAVYVEEKKKASISATAWYRNKVQYEISRSPGLKLQIVDTTIAAVDQLNQIRGRKAGITVLSVNYLTKTVNLPVVVFPEYVTTDTVATAQKIYKTGNPDPYGVIDNIQIYPNPTVGNFTMEYQLNQQREITIIILDVYGKLISEWHEKQLPGQHRFMSGKIDLPAGIYLIKVCSGDQTESRKLVIRK